MHYASSFPAYHSGVGPKPIILRFMYDHLMHYELFNCTCCNPQHPFYGLPHMCKYLATPCESGLSILFAPYVQQQIIYSIATKVPLLTLLTCHETPGDFSGEEDAQG
jgi:hypothetical protein